MEVDMFERGYKHIKLHRFQPCQPPKKNNAVNSNKIYKNVKKNIIASLINIVTKVIHTYIQYIHTLIVFHNNELINQSSFTWTESGAVTSVEPRALAKTLLIRTQRRGRGFQGVHFNMGLFNTCTTIMQLAYC